MRYILEIELLLDLASSCMLPVNLLRIKPKKASNSDLAINEIP